ncbi:polysaccharide deacetylase family protein [Frankia sp. AiPs1]|nr:polysaccharide deacetylase family protein [Frankia sp. AiPs1]
MSRRRLFAWSASSAAGIVLLTAAEPAQAIGGASGAGHGAARSASRQTAARPAGASRQTAAHSADASQQTAAHSAGASQQTVGRSSAARGSTVAASTPVTTQAPPAPRAPAYRIHDLRPDAPADSIALTIDDGPHPVWTPRILEVLRANRVTATFSVVGAQAVANPELVRRIVADGHSLCNHTMTHPQPFSRRTPDQIRVEMTRAQSAIVDAGAEPPRLFRAPGGDWSPAVLAAATGLGMTSLGWDVDPRDWARPGTASIRQSLGRARPGDILLCHDGGGDRAQTVAALRRVLPLLRARGLSFVPL